MSGYNLYVAAMRKFNKVGLSDDQKAKVKQLALAQGAAAFKAEAGGEKKALGKLRNEFYASVEKDVLTDEQRTKAKQKKAPKAPKKKPEKKKDAA